MLVCSARSRSGSAMISVPELIVASSIPRLVHDRAHHLYSVRSTLRARWMRVGMPSADTEMEADVNVRLADPRGGARPRAMERVSAMEIDVAQMAGLAYAPGGG